MTYGLGGRHGSDLALLWLWCRLAAAAAIQALAWEIPYAAGVSLKRKKKTFKDIKSKSLLWLTAEVEARDFLKRQTI